MNKALYALVVVFVVLLLIGGGYYFLKPKTYKSTSQTPSPQATNTETSTPEATIESSAEVKESMVVLTKSGFNPGSLTIKAGEKVTWKNESGTTGSVYSSPHPIHTDYTPLNLGTFDNGETMSLVFPEKGTYTYHNHLNPSQTGKIIVE